MFTYPDRDLFQEREKRTKRAINLWLEQKLGCAFVDRIHRENPRYKKVQEKIARQNAAEAHLPTQILKLGFRNFGKRDLGFKGDTDNYYWHWCVAIGENEQAFEVAANDTTMAMAIKGPDGMVASTEEHFISDHTAKTDLRRDFDGCLVLPKSTKKTITEVENFSKQWCSSHPSYTAIGPNCQTYCEDLYTFLTGDYLPYEKSATRMMGRAPQDGPEKDEKAEWIVLPNKPGVTPEEVELWEKDHPVPDEADAAAA